MSSYLRLTHEQESPEIFHRWVLVSVVMTMLGRRVWLHRGFYELRANEYVILIGASGKVKKDTAIDIGTLLLNDCPNAPTYFGGDVTPSKMLGQLSKMCEKRVPGTGERMDAAALICCPEFGSFVRNDSQGQEMIKLLTNIYKSPGTHDYLTRAHGEERLYNVCINLLGGSTTRWLRDSIPETAVAGGFTARVIFVYSATARARAPNPRPPKDHKEITEDLTADLAEIGLMEGAFTVEEKARGKANRWYRQLDYPEDSPIGPYFERKLDHIYKLCMALSAMESDDRIITVAHYKKAKEMLEQLEHGMKHVLTQVELSPVMSTNLKILEYIKRHSPVTRIYLQQLVSRFADKVVLDSAIATLEGAYIKTSVDGTKKVYTALKSRKNASKR